ncbi:metallophosphoesterase [Sporosarcina pasteurii]|uniref:Phosphoesterase n=1 Tax=Sporosarcina pasteurii TaxID=1474 RepID=A0A380C3M2_SPOPA|nr:metallophosphoesterase [Sporosarcina pasteurii]MDS9471657.1 metallophosphoesterase [Sporosarcina pasteurii]QBQ04741.1 metallophosphoesterase [Sporosarcina pasteurii]SUJ11658.1 Putative metallophosphoesterase MG207 homolog [Sporosarcina pasteurii]
MKIIVLSDSHGDKTTIEKVATQQADAYFHCGDSEIAYHDPVFQSMYKVAGNCDIDDEYPDEVTTTIGGKKIFMVHGHRHDVKGSMMGMYYSAKEKAVDIALFGHSHIYGAEMKDGILFVNPGSTMLPRGGNPATYAVIELGEKVVVTFKDLNHEIVDSVEF